MIVARSCVHIVMSAVSWYLIVELYQGLGNWQHNVCKLTYTLCKLSDTLYKMEGLQ